MTPFLLSAKQMRHAEEVTISSGVASHALMEQAGKAIAEEIMKGWEKRPVCVLCGPGNNGGDGLVVARLLAEAGWPVRLGLLDEAQDLTGDAAMMRDKVGVEIEAMNLDLLQGAKLIVDALFGIGLSRPVEGKALEMVKAVNAHSAPVVAVDIPSGVNADTGGVMGDAVRASITVTFFARKNGHLLFPGRALSGAVSVADIGIHTDVLTAIKPKVIENLPQVWGAVFPRPGFMSHKFTRGSAVVFSGPRLATGAARLSAMAAMRAGAGLVTIASPVSAADENAAHVTSAMLRIVETPDHVEGILSDRRITASIFGPGAGVGQATAEKVLAILKQPASAVLDADALTSFGASAEQLFAALRDHDVMTPHGGEFGRLFAGLISQPDDRLNAACDAAKKAGCVVVLKGADTVIAAPDGRAMINSNAPPDLATAGSGDVLAGLIGGLRAQGMPAFEAACAGVWVHGACGQVLGPGLIAEDLPTAVPQVYRSLLSPPQSQQSPDQ